VAQYACSFDLRVWHKALLSIYHAEANSLSSIEQLEDNLSVYSVEAWRVMYALSLLRVVAGESCIRLFTKDEWQVLARLIRHTKRALLRPPSIREAVYWVAEIGGFSKRGPDDEPNAEALWRGFRQLDAALKQASSSTLRILPLAKAY
jgi:Transposase Tn5 dimerisation domain